MGARLADIAAQAGVSEATVSRVLNGKPGVAEGTRQAVLTALDVLGYERPAKLRQHSAGLVGLIVPELENPIFPAFAQVIESALARQGYTPVLCTQTPAGCTRTSTPGCCSSAGWRASCSSSGLHADVTTDPARYQALRRRGLPIVLVNGYTEGVDAPFISNDDVASMELSVGHLVELGHTRIGLAVGPGGSSRRCARSPASGRRCAAGWGCEDVERWIESHPVQRRGRRCRRRAAARARVPRRSSAARTSWRWARSARCGPGAARAAGRLGRRLRRLDARSRSPTRRSRRCGSRFRRWVRRRSGRCSTRSPGSPRRGPSSCSGPSSSSAGRRGRRRSGRRPDRFHIPGQGVHADVTFGYRQETPPRPSRVRPESRRCRAMRITDVLRRKGDLVVTIQPKDTVRALLDALAEHKVGALVVAGAERRRRGHRQRARRRPAPAGARERGCSRSRSARS